MTKPVVTVDVVSDVVCPWCYIGKRRLEKAIDRLKDELDVRVTYHPFELNPTMPKEGVNQREYLSKKFGGDERYEQITAHTTQVAATEGLQFDFSRQHVSPNTFQCHRLIAFARTTGHQPALKEALMSAYFEKGIDLSKTSNIVDVAVGVGMNREEVQQFLDSDELTTEVKLEEDMNYKRGISGVPFYIINNKYGVSGAQPSDVFEKALREISLEMGDAAACAVDEPC